MIYDKIKADSIAARRERNTTKATLLVTLLSDITMIGKNANREVTDDDCNVVIKKFLKGIDEMIARGVSESVIERQILEVYLPKQLTEDEIRGIIETFIHSNGKNFGSFMKMMNSSYKGLYDGATTKKLFETF